jgi:hypothetical protein
MGGKKSYHGKASIDAGDVNLNLKEKHAIHTVIIESV